MKQFLKENALLIAILAAIIGGTIFVAVMAYKDAQNLFSTF